MATLQELIAAIPTAQDGAVIGIEYHNTMLAAIKLLATQGGGGGGGPVTVNQAFAPQFSANDGSPAWLLQSGVASKPGGNATQAIGWMGMQMPDGYQIDHMVITGNKTGNVGSFSATLFQYSLGTGALQQAVLAAPLDTAVADSAGNFSATARAGSVAVVNNSQSKYVLIARIVGADAAATASIYGILVVCTQAVGIGGGFGILT
jgi:hypothetical protein